LPGSTEALDARTKEIGFMLHSLLLASAFISQMGGYSLPPPRNVMPTPRPETPTPAPAARPAPPPLATIAAVPGRGLRDVPNLTIKQYDVAGKNLKEVIKNLTAQRPKNASGQPITAATNWNIETAFHRRTTKGQCKIADAHATVSATVELPKLLNEAKFPPRDLLSWQNYLANLEVTAAGKLWFVQDHTGDIEKAVVASSCEGAQAAGASAIERLRTQAAAFQPPAPAAAPVAPEAKPAS
jgi:predicted secreted Zn-dependent protease